MNVHLRWGLAVVAMIAGTVALTWAAVTRLHPAAPTTEAGTGAVAAAAPDTATLPAPNAATPAETVKAPAKGAPAASDEYPIHLLVIFSAPLTTTTDPRVGDKASFIDKLKFRSPRGRPVEITRVPMGSNEMIERVINGTLKADVILPSTSVFLDLADQEWTLRKGKKLFSDRVNLMDQPYVLATRKPMAEALGWPDKEIGWADVAEVASKGWAATGNPQWGPLRLLDAHPEFSDAGYQAVVSVAQSVLGIKKGFTPERVKSSQLVEVFQSFDKTTVWYPTSLDDLLWNERQDMTPHCHMAFLPEHLVIDLNDQHARRKAPPQWVAIYPKGGTLVEDVTAGVVDREWVTPEKREAAVHALKLMLDPQIQKMFVARGYRPASTKTPLSAPIDERWGVNPKRWERQSMPPIEEVLECKAAWQRAVKGDVRPVAGGDRTKQPAAVEAYQARKAAASSGRASRATPLVQCVRKCKPSTVFVLVDNKQKLGSGFVVDPRGYIITNYHVVGESDDVAVRIGGSDKVLPVEVLTRRANADLALLRVKTPGTYQPMSMADADPQDLGEQVVVIGNPLGYSWTVTTGIVSALDREIPAPDGKSTLKKVIQTDAPINPGNSGGPVVNIDGELIGVACAMHSGAQNIGFVIPVSSVKENMAKLIPK
jgi:hypothetical protein